MICVEWIDRFNLGIHQIDEQHKRLVAIMNKICNALNEGRGNEVRCETVAWEEDGGGVEVAISK